MAVAQVVQDVRDLQGNRSALMFNLDKNLFQHVKRSITESPIVESDAIFMCGCDSGCDGCNGCTGCATYGCYPDGWHDKYIQRITNERKAG